MGLRRRAGVLRSRLRRRSRHVSAQCRWAGFAGSGNTVYAISRPASAWVVPLRASGEHARARPDGRGPGGRGPRGRRDVFLGDTLTITPTSSRRRRAAAHASAGTSTSTSTPARASRTTAGARRASRTGQRALGSPSTRPRRSRSSAPATRNRRTLPAAARAAGTPSWRTPRPAGAGLHGADGRHDEAPEDRLEATNSLGSANTAVFTLNWKVPAARFASTQVLSGSPRERLGRPPVRELQVVLRAIAERARAGAAARARPACRRSRRRARTSTGSRPRTRTATRRRLRAARPRRRSPSRLRAGLHGQRRATGPITAFTYQTPDVQNNFAARRADARRLPVLPLRAPVPRTTRALGLAWATSAGRHASTSATIPIPATGGATPSRSRRTTRAGRRWPDRRRRRLLRRSP